jgi:GT2 family glycosyltransferase
MNYLSISLVLYKNDSEILSQTLSSISNSLIPYRMSIVDNSPTSELQDLCIKFPNVDYYHNPSNPGFGASHNMAIDKLHSEKAPYHLILNPDVYFTPNTISELIKYLEQNEDIGLIQPKICFPDGATQYLCKRYPSLFVLFLRRFIPKQLHFLFKNYLDWFEMRDMGYDKITDVIYLSGCFMLFRKEYLDEVGYFDENIFMYFEDADITLRMSKKYRTIFYPHVQIFHYWAQGSYNSWRLALINIQSAFYFFQKHGLKII